MYHDVLVVERISLDKKSRYMVEGDLNLLSSILILLQQFRSIHIDIIGVMAVTCSLPSGSSFGPFILLQILSGTRLHTSMKLNRVR